MMCNRARWWGTLCTSPAQNSFRWKKERKICMTDGCNIWITKFILERFDFQEYMLVCSLRWICWLYLSGNRVMRSAHGARRVKRNIHDFSGSTFHRYHRSTSRIIQHQVCCAYVITTFHVPHARCVRAFKTNLNQIPLYLCICYDQDILNLIFSTLLTCLPPSLILSANSSINPNRPQNLKQTEMLRTARRDCVVWS